MVDDCEYCPAVWHRMAVRSLEAAQSESASLRARLAEAEAERGKLIKEADEERVAKYEAQSDLAQAREELAALRAELETRLLCDEEAGELPLSVLAERALADALERDTAYAERDLSEARLKQALSKLSALPGVIESAPNPPAAPSEASPLPWHFVRDADAGYFVRTAAGEAVARCFEEEDAAFIVARANQSAHRADSGGD
jgi:hypothetical protein